MQVKSKVYLLLEFAVNGNLFWYIRRQKSLSEQRGVELFRQTCDSIRYLHTKGFIHRDLKPENILLDADFKVKVCDFGWCTEFEKEDEMRKTFCGTYEYMAPEIFDKKPYDEKVDIWALGILLFELLHGKSPYRGNSVIDIYKNIQKEDIRFSTSCSSEARDLVLKILKKNPAARLTMDQIFEHPLMRKYQPAGVPPLVARLDTTSSDGTKPPKSPVNGANDLSMGKVSGYKRDEANGSKDEQTNVSTADEKRNLGGSGLSKKNSFTPAVNAFGTYFMSKGTDERKKSVDKESERSRSKPKHLELAAALQRVVMGRGELPPKPSGNESNKSGLQMSALGRHYHSESQSGGRMVDSSLHKHLPSGGEYLISGMGTKPVLPKKSILIDNHSIVQRSDSNDKNNKVHFQQDKYFLDPAARKVKRDNVKSLSRASNKPKIDPNNRTFDESEQKNGQSNGDQSKPSRKHLSSHDQRPGLELKKSSLAALEMPRDKSDHALHIRNIIGRKMTETRRAPRDNKSSLDYTNQSNLKSSGLEQSKVMNQGNYSPSDPNKYDSVKSKNKARACKELLDRISVITF